MRRECREGFSRHRLQRKPPASDPDMHQCTCVTHVPWCMWGSPTRDGGENVPGIPGACASCNFTYLSRGPCTFSCDAVIIVGDIQHIEVWTKRSRFCRRYLEINLSEKESRNLQQTGLSELHEYINYRQKLWNIFYYSNCLHFYGVRMVLLYLKYIPANRYYFWGS